MIEKSKWIEKFENEYDRKKIFCIHGNIHDIFFYNQSTTSLDEYFKKKFGIEKTEFYFNNDYFDKDLEEDSEEQGNEETDLFSRNNGLKLVTEIKDTDKNILIIKDPKLFFNDLCEGKNTSPSLRFFLEYVYQFKLDSLDAKKIIFISEDRSDFPERIIINNPYTSEIYVDFPDEEERATYIAQCTDFTNERAKTGLSSEIIKEDYNIFIKITNKRMLKDIRNIYNKGIAEGTIIDAKKSVKDIINSYNNGNKESAWSKLNKSTLRKLEEKLENRVKGQREAIEFVKKIIFRAKLDLNTAIQPYSTRPKGIMFFIGPSGVGKTELAKALTEVIFGDEAAFKRFDMSEYKEKESINKLIGSDPGYVGYNEGGQLTNWIMNNPYSIILFDEIEKANTQIWDIFLQILDDGRLTDGKGNTGYFNEAILVFTSNIGNAEYNSLEDSGKKKEAEINREKIYRKALEMHFEKISRIEILNRFGENIIIFNHIKGEILKQIIETKIKITIANIQKKLGKIQIKLENDKDIIEFFYAKALKSVKFGARLVNSLIEKYFINEISEYIIENKIENGEISVSIQNEKLVFKEL